MDNMNRGIRRVRLRRVYGPPSWRRLTNFSRRLVRIVEPVRQMLQNLEPVARLRRVARFRLPRALPPAPHRLVPDIGGGGDGIHLMHIPDDARIVAPSPPSTPSPPHAPSPGSSSDEMQMLREDDEDDLIAAFRNLQM